MNFSIEQRPYLGWIAARVTPWIIMMMMVASQHRRNIVLLGKHNLLTRMVQATKEFLLFPPHILKIAFKQHICSKVHYHPYQCSITIFVINWNVTINTPCNCWEINLPTKDPVSFLQFFIFLFNQPTLEKN